jgi:hypothetical protein
MLLQVLSQTWTDPLLLPWLQSVAGGEIREVAWQGDDQLLLYTTGKVHGKLHEGRAVKLLQQAEPALGTLAIWTILRTLDFRAETHEFLAQQAFRTRVPAARFDPQTQSFAAVVPATAVPRTGTTIKVLDTQLYLAKLGFSPRLHQALHHYLVRRLYGDAVAEG